MKDVWVAERAVCHNKQLQDAPLNLPDVGGGMDIGQHQQLTSHLTKIMNPAA